MTSCICKRVRETSGWPGIVQCSVQSSGLLQQVHVQQAFHVQCSLPRCAPAMAMSRSKGSYLSAYVGSPRCCAQPGKVEAHPAAPLARGGHAG